MDNLTPRIFFDEPSIDSEVNEEVITEKKCEACKFNPFDPETLLNRIDDCTKTDCSQYEMRPRLEAEEGKDSTTMEEEDEGKDDALPAAKQKQGISKQSQTNCNKNNTSLPDHLNWASEFELSAEEADAIAAPEWIIQNLIISGHIVLIPAEPNGGKTTIMFHLAGQMVNEGYNVFYVNSDISGGDAKPLVELAKINGFTLMLSDMKAGMSMDDIIFKLIEMSEAPDHYDGVVFIFDTVKKMLNVINKNSAKRFFKLFRKLSAKGMTVILLAHTNKYKDAEGNPIYEGTGDMRSDVDELIYLIPQKHDDKSMTVTTQPDKVRGAFEPITFNIAPDRTVTLQNEVVNTTLANQIADELKKNQGVIDSISQAILDGSTSQKDIIKYCADNDGHGERIVKKVLIKYTINGDEPETSDANVKIETKIWSKAKGGKNSSIFSIIEPST